MPTPFQSHEAHQALAKFAGNKSAAARSLKITNRTLQDRLNVPDPGNIGATPEEALKLANKKIDVLETSLHTVQRDLTVLTGLTEAARYVDPPTWLVTPGKKSAPGTPVTIWSDWHWGEVVEPTQVNGVNKYNLKIANERARRLVTTTVELLKTHVANPDYPGIVLCLGGDMMSGDIHDELKQTNETPTPPAMLDLLGVLIWGINLLADEFGRVHIPVVAGNHGRMTHKPVAKMMAHQNWDWVIGKLLQMHFAKDKRITFQISDASDVMFKVHNTTYLLTHGNQFFGGSGIAGMLSPLMLGDARKRKRQQAIRQPYDVMLMGHWHNLFQGRGLIVNNCLKGYDEYAFQNNFDFAPASQALWVVHPNYGLNWWMPIYVQDAVGVDKAAPWCAVRA